MKIKILTINNHPYKASNDVLKLTKITEESVRRTRDRFEVIKETVKEDFHEIIYHTGLNYMTDIYKIEEIEVL